MTANGNLQKLALLKSINIKSSLNESFKDLQTDKLAGFLQNGKFSWIAVDGILRIVSTDTGSEIAYYNFAKHHGIGGCIINHVEEVSYLPGICLLAISIEFTNSAARAGMVCIFCVQGCKLLGSMDMCERITCCKYISWETCRRSVLRQFHGTLAIGTDQGKLFLVDLMIPKDIKEITTSPSYDSEIFPMINIPAELDQIQIAHHHKKVISGRENGEKCFFSIQLRQVLEETGAIISMLCMPNLNMLSVGLDDGRMILYDLVDLQAFHLAYPPANRAPLTHMSYIEPSDDPRSAVYIWTFHSSKDGAIAVMHSIMFDTKVNGFYENFRSCSVRLTMPIFHKDTFPVCCRSITKILTQDEEDVLTIILLAWTSPAKNRSNIMIFDLNQWYKEEMPSIGDWRNRLSYTVVFEIPNISLDVILNEKSLLPFNSIMRPEEHFYPNSLSFDLTVLEAEKFSHYRWNGVQNIILQQFNSIGPQIILEPSFYFNELLKVAITPQFYDVNFGMATPLDLKREFLLSVALEYNFTGFLKKCAWAWADGSYLGKDGNIGVGLSTLTEWIWNRVRAIKDVCNSLCQPLFDYSEQRIDCGTQKQLSLCCKQLKILSDLLQMIAKDYRKYIPESIISQIQTQANTVKMASDYQEVLQWLLNVGLLPEGHYNQTRDIDENDFVIVPYPYRTISSHYDSQRAKLSDDNEDDKPSKYLFIDAFIENECCNYEILDWGCLYPPKSIQSLLRSLLVPDIPLENKYVIFIYLFMDITNALNDSSYSSIVRNLIKFPAVFKMNPSAIKRTQAFWNLDNGQLETAVEELISPLSHDRYLPKWQRELLIGALLKQNGNSLALRALRCPGNSISSDLEVSTLLANNLISEALKIQRASGDRNLLEKLFHKILNSSNYEQLLDLALSEEEGKVLRDYLQNTDLSNCVNLHFVYLLQRSKFIDAAQLMDSFSSANTNINLEPPKQVLNAYYSAMEPTTRKLTSMVYADNQVHVKEIPSPFSVNLIKSRCNASNDIYKKCVQSITEATYDSNQEIKEMPFIGTPKLGIFEYKQPIVQMQEINFPMEFNENGKRLKDDNNDGIFKLDDFVGPKMKRRKLEELIEPKKYTKSFIDKRIGLLTNFKNRRQKLNFSSRTPNTSSRVSPDRVAFFGNLLTPVVEKRTPQKIIPERALTPASILKTRSCRSSISPTQSRFSEYDDNKSVRSITFAALPGENESSLHDSSYLDESFGEQQQQQMDSSAEFYSPEKSPKIIPIYSETSIKSAKSSDIIVLSSSSSILSGPKARPPIKSRSTTPNEQLSQQSSEQQSNKKSSQEEKLEELSQDQDNEEIRQQKSIEQMETELIVKEINASEITAQSTGIADTTYNPMIADTIVINNTSEISFEVSCLDPLNRKSILKSNENLHRVESDESDTSEIDAPIYQYDRKSILPHDFGKNFGSNISSSSSSSSSSSIEKIQADENEDDIAADEHFEEEELPEHSDYDNEEEENQDSEDSCEYGNVDLDDSESSESDEDVNSGHKLPDENEVIEIPDSDDDDVQIESNSPKLPPISEFENKQPEREIIQDVTHQEIDETSNQERRKILELATAEIEETEKPTSTEEQMIDILYDDIEEENVEQEIESPVFEEISPQKSKSPEREQVVEVQEENENNVEVVETSGFDDIVLVEDAPKIETEQEEEIINEQHVEEKSVLVAESVTTTVENDTNETAVKSHKIPAEEESQKVEHAQESTENHPSEMSADCSFASAHNELNEGLIASANETLMSVDEKQSEEINDETNVLDKAVVEEEEIGTTNEQENVSEISEEDVTNVLEVAQLETTAEDVTEKMETAEDIVDEEVVEKESRENDKEIVEEETLNIMEVAQLEVTESERVQSTELILEEEEFDKSKENPLNEGIIETTQSENTISQETQVESQKSDDKYQPDEADKELEQIMASKSPESSQNIPVDLSTPKRRSSRAKSEITELENPRLKRAVSVPSSGTSSPVSRSSRASSELRHNPKVLLREKILERIEESPSSGIMTRNKSRHLQEQQSRESTPQSRAQSEEVDSAKTRTPRRRSTAGTPTNITPRRVLTRAASRDSISGDNVVSSSQIDEKTPEEAYPKRRGRKKASVASDDEHEETKSTKSTRSTSSKKKEAPTSSSKISPAPSTSPMDEISVSNRRLTRAQLGVLEKSRQLAEKMSSEISESPAKLRPTISDVPKSNIEDDSDNESVKSDSTTSRSSRKRKMPKRFSQQESETSSITSKTSRKSKSPQKKHMLSVIQEEADSEVSEKSSTGRSQRRKK